MSGPIIEDDTPSTGSSGAQQQQQAGGSTTFGGGQATGNTGGPSMSGASPLNALGFISAFGLFSMTKNVEEYLKNVRTQIQQKLMTLPTGTMAIREIALSSPVGAYAYVATNYDGSKSAVVLDFKECAGAEFQNLIPESNRLNGAIQSLLQREENVKIRLPIVVTPDMYDRADQMASTIIRSFMYRTNPVFARSTAKDLCGNLTLVVSTNLADAQNFENRNSPHGVRPRADIGLTISIQTRKRDQMFMSPGITGGDYETTPVMSVLAMVDVAGPVNDATRANLSMPVIRITDITSVIPHPGFLYMAIELATEYFAKGGMWKSPFRSYTAGSQNLGPLIFEADGKTLFRAKNDVQTNDLIQRYMTTHQLLCVDIAAGRARIPELYDFMRTDQSVIMNTAAAFFNIRPPEQSVVARAASHVSTDFIGVYGDPKGNGLLDSRLITYLQLAANGAVDQEVRRVLMNYSVSAQERAAKIAQLTGGSFQSLYLDNIEFIQAGWASWIAGAMMANGIRLTDPNGTYGATALSSLNGVLTDYNAMQSTVSNFNRNGGFMGGMNMGNYFG